MKWLEDIIPALQGHKPRTITLERSKVIPFLGNQDAISGEFTVWNHGYKPGHTKELVFVELTPDLLDFFRAIYPQVEAI